MDGGRNPHTISTTDTEKTKQNDRAQVSDSKSAKPPLRAGPKARARVRLSWTVDESGLSYRHSFEPGTLTAACLIRRG